jgi:uncharacterized membrane protein YgcG
MKNSRILSLTMTAALCAFGGFAFAQGGGFLAPPEALDTLNGGSTSGGLDANRLLGSARDAAFGSPAPGGAPKDPFSPPGGDGAPSGTPSFSPPPSGFGGPPSGFTPGAPGAPGAAGLGRTTTVIGGFRIISALSGEVLNDARSAKVISTDGYFDDGEKGGDAVAGDGVFSAIVTDSNYISAGEFLIKTRSIKGLSVLEDLSPQDFSNVRVATNEPVSSLPKLTDLEQDRDVKLAQFLDRFLLDFRVNADDPASELLPVFIPFPPKAPNFPLPVEFSPRARPNEVAGEAGAAGRSGGAGRGGRDGGGSSSGGGVNLDDSVNGTPIGGASSRYF